MSKQNIIEKQEESLKKPIILFDQSKEINQSQLSVKEILSYHQNTKFNRLNINTSDLSSNSLPGRLNKGDHIDKTMLKKTNYEEKFQISSQKINNRIYDEKDQINKSQKRKGLVKKFKFVFDEKKLVQGGTGQNIWENDYLKIQIMKKIKKEIQKVNLHERLDQTLRINQFSKLKMDPNEEFNKFEDFFEQELLSIIEAKKQQLLSLENLRKRYEFEMHCLPKIENKKKELMPQSQNILKNKNLKNLNGKFVHKSPNKDHDKDDSRFNHKKESC